MSLNPLSQLLQARKGCQARSIQFRRCGANSELPFLNVFGLSVDGLALFYGRRLVGISDGGPALSTFNGSDLYFHSQASELEIRDTGIRAVWTETWTGQLEIG